MRAGKLDRVIRIDRFSAGLPDAFGTVTPVFAPMATLRAQVVQSSTEEFMQAAGTTDQTAIIFRTRWLDGVTTSDRVLYENSFFNIKEIKELGRRRGLELRAVRAE